MLQLIDEQGVDPYEGSVRYVRRRDRRGAAPRGRLVEHQLPRRPQAAGIEDLFEEIVDGARRPAERHLAASPRRTPSSPAAEALGVEPAQAAVFEDALPGVEAGRAGDFGYVVGVDRVGQAEALREHGADVVVEDLAELLD